MKTTKHNTHTVENDDDEEHMRCVLYAFSLMAALE